MYEWYEVSFSAPGDGEWGKPVSVFAVSFIRAAEERMKEEAQLCDEWLDSEWDAHVEKGNREWYVKLSRPRRTVVVEGCHYFSSDREADPSP